MDRTRNGLPLGRRILVIGTTGSGKTTVARILSQRFEVPHIELDALFWKPNWRETPDEEFLPDVDRQTDASAWVLDGNYSRTRPITWPKAETVVWLDLPFPTVFWQLLGRTISRAASRHPMWGGCIEDWRNSFLSRDSILLWCVRTHWTRKRNVARALERPEYRHLHVLRLRSRRAVRRWLARLG